jgi:hypothetical protein
MDACAICGKLFRRHYRRGCIRQLYCSKSCTYKSRQEERACKTCGVRFTRNSFSKRKDYCSPACIERSPCLTCGKIIIGRYTFQCEDRRFCTRRCAAIMKSALAKKEYKVLGFAATIVRKGHLCCEKCDSSDVRCLVVHHLDKDRRNNQVNNLKTLCSNCHFAEHWPTSDKRQRDVKSAEFLASYLMAQKETGDDAPDQQPLSQGSGNQHCG